MSLEIKPPEIILSNLEELGKLVNKHPKNIPLKDAADYLGIDTASLRAALKNNTCPFGFGWQKTQDGYWGFSVQATPLYLFYTNSQGIALKM
ncbi:MAG: hypothetical protein K0S55_412 [Clostridia bacterium]|jgi:hypothetical protein|nr:hypothetical protein [Clostridia bacterium]